MADTPDPLANSCVLTEVVVLYPHVFEPHLPRGSASDATPTYQLTVLLPPGYDMTALQRIALDAAKKTFGSDASKLLQAGVIKSPFRNQVEKAAQGKEGFSDDPSAKYITAKSERAPNVMDQKVQPLMDPSRIYGGCICNVQVNAYAWSHPTGGKGISFGLQNIQLVRDGTRLGTANPDPKTVFKPLGVPPEEGVKSDADIRSIFG